ncbi:hypothetical protein [Streptomyces sp. NPDC052042]|uniref:hypothetical protein n=1 Tax=Streptomyces sp. NPDC052042 TaxID=3365683 RepID=UPI0037CE9BE6
MPTLSVPTPPIPDAPAELRAWAADDVRQTEALHRLATGAEVSFVARDEACWYRLTASPLRLPQPAPQPGAALINA